MLYEAKNSVVVCPMVPDRTSRETRRLAPMMRREDIFVFQKPGQRPAPVSAQTGTVLSRGLLGPLHETAALGIRVAPGEIVAGGITDPPLPLRSVAPRSPK